MPAPIETFMPDPNTYTVSINKRQWELIHRGLLLLEATPVSLPLHKEGDDELLESLIDMLDPKGSTGGLAPSPCVNGLVL